MIQLEINFLRQQNKLTTLGQNILLLLPNEQAWRSSYSPQAAAFMGAATTHYARKRPRHVLLHHMQKVKSLLKSISQKFLNTSICLVFPACSVSKGFQLSNDFVANAILTTRLLLDQERNSNPYWRQRYGRLSEAGLRPESGQIMILNEF